MAGRLPGIRNIRGAGLLQGFDLDPAVYGPAPGPAIERAACEHGLLARIGKNFIVFAPPLTIDEAGIAMMVDRLETSIASAG